MKSLISIIIVYFLLLLTSAAFAQRPEEKVVITGVRFSYPLIENWIREYKAADPSADISIQPRNTSDPASYDILIEAYEPEAPIRENRDFAYIGRYAMLPVANAASKITFTFGHDGLTRDRIEEIFFHNVTNEKRKSVDVPFTVYTRIQQAGTPITFAHYFGFEQNDINGKGIAGSDEHLIAAVQKDSSGITYAPLGIAYDVNTRATRKNLAVLAVDLDGNGKLSDNEKTARSLDDWVALLESRNEVRNIPVGYLHLSVAKAGAKPEAIGFIKWVLLHGSQDLHKFGFLQPDDRRLQEAKAKFESTRAN